MTTSIVDEAIALAEPTENQSKLREIRINNLRKNWHTGPAPIVADFTRKSRIGYVPLSEISVDQAYQRPIDASRVTYMAHHWDQDKAGLIVVNRRSSGQFFVIDGQQRHAAMQLTSNRPEQVLAEIFEGLTIQQEAKLFSELDTKRRGLTQGAVFQALVTAGDQNALEILDAAQNVGLTVNYKAGNVSNNLRAYGALMTIHRRAGKAGLQRILNASSKAWPENRYWGAGSILIGLELFFRRYPRAKDAHLIDALSRTDPHRIETDARILNQALSSALGQWVARVILGHYNRNMKKNRLADWENA